MDSHTPEGQTVGILKAAELTGVSRRTIYNWLETGKLEYVRTAGGAVRILVESLWRDPKYRSRQYGPVNLQHVEPEPVKP